MWEMMLKQGQEAYKKSDFETAEGLLKVALEHAPGDTEKAFVLNHMAATQRSLGKLADAVASWRSALEKVTASMGPDHSEAGGIVHNLAGVYAISGRTVEAEACYQECLRIVRLNGASEPLKVADYLSVVATYYYNTSSFPQAVKLLEEAAARRYGVLSDHLEVARTLITLGGVREAMNDHEGAEADRERAKQMLAKVYGPESKQLAHVMLTQGQSLSERRKYGPAREIFEACLGMLEKLAGPESPEVAEVLEHTAATHMAEGHPEKAEPLYQRALSITEKGKSGPDTQVAQRIVDLARVRQHDKDYPQALTLLEKALPMLREAAGPAHPLTLQALDRKVEVLISQERYEEARELASANLKLRTETYGATHPTVAAGLTSMAMTHMHKKEFLQAAGLLEQAVAIWDAGPPVPDLARTMTLYNLGGALHGALEYYKAEDCYRRALNDMELYFGEVHPVTAHLLTNLASLLQSTSRQGQAKQMEERAQKVREALAAG